MKLDINNLEQYTLDEEFDKLRKVKKRKNKRTKMRKYTHNILQYGKEEEYYSERI